MPSQRLIEACRRNWAKRGPLTPRGRERLRRAAVRDRPWEHSTGPRTSGGKVRSRQNMLQIGLFAKTLQPHAVVNRLDHLDGDAVWDGPDELWETLGLPGKPDKTALADLTCHYLRAHNDALVNAGITLARFMAGLDRRLAAEVLEAASATERGCPG